MSRADCLRPGQIPRCASCGAAIVWMRTKSGRRIPVDLASADPAHQNFDPVMGHISHFATCPQADQHRRRR